MFTQKGDGNETDDVCDLDPIKCKKRWMCNISIQWTLITVGRMYFFWCTKATKYNFSISNEQNSK